MNFRSFKLLHFFILFSKEVHPVVNSVFREWFELALVEVVIGVQRQISKAIIAAY